MAELVWDTTGSRKYQTGVDKGVLYPMDSSGAYPLGVAWNGLVSVTETPEGAEPSDQYADNIKYLTLLSAETLKGTIEAFTFPDEFMACDGSIAAQVGVNIGQQARSKFGLSFRSKLGNDVDGDEYGYIIHLLYGCLASPSEKAFETVGESPEPITFSWEFSTTPATVTGFKPTALITIDSTKVDSADLAALELLLYGAVAAAPKLPTPDEVIAIFTP